MKTTIVLPAYKEKENLELLVPKILDYLDGHLEEILIIDDHSGDGTEKFQTLDRVRVFTRKNVRGLGSAIFTGIHLAKTPKVIVMDSDGQHPVDCIPKLLEALDTNNLVVGSRYVRGGGTRGWSRFREFGSRACSLLAKPLTGLNDSTSGIFAMNKYKVDLSYLKIEGFKLGLEIFSRNKAVEVPYVFGPRYHGTSKMTTKQVFYFFKQLVRLYWYKFDLTRMTKFCIVGTGGLGINSAVLFLMTDVGGLFYLLSNLIAVGSAMIFNFTFNKKWTFKK